MYIYAGDLDEIRDDVITKGGQQCIKVAPHLYENTF
jgi:hypothetical protein